MYIQQDVLLVNLLIEEVTFFPSVFGLALVHPATGFKLWSPKQSLVCLLHHIKTTCCFCGESFTVCSKFESLHLHLLITYIYNVIHLGSNVNLKVTKKATEVAFFLYAFITFSGMLTRICVLLDCSLTSYINKRNRRTSSHLGQLAIPLSNRLILHKLSGQTFSK